MQKKKKISKEIKIIIETISTRNKNIKKQNDNITSNKWMRGTFFYWFYFIFILRIRTRIISFYFAFVASSPSLSTDIADVDQDVQNCLSRICIARSGLYTWYICRQALQYCAHWMSIHISRLNESIFIIILLMPVVSEW